MTTCSGAVDWAALGTVVCVTSTVAGDGTTVTPGAGGEGGQVVLLPFVTASATEM